jgi:hypothetical protein
MPPALPKPEQRVKKFFAISKLKLFRNDADYVACYGQPALAEDGWIINLPASYFFEGDYRSLPFGEEFHATWAHAQAAIKKPLANYIHLHAYSNTWKDKVSEAGMPNYQYADMFRDISAILVENGQPNLAFCFIKIARDLRPEGPVIYQMLIDLESICKSSP